MFKEIVSLLTSSSGSMVYHLLLSFSILSALIPAINQLIEARTPKVIRRVLGLGLLLALRLGLFLVAGLGSMGIGFFLDSLPMLNRLVDTLSIILVCWLWTFPEPGRKPDLIAGGISLLMLFAGLIATVSWINHAVPNTFNDSRIAYTWNLFNILLLMAGGVLLVLLQPRLWSLGLTMVTALFIGEFGHLLFPNNASDYPFLIRLIQIAAFPLLLGLPDISAKSQVISPVETPVLEIPPPILQRTRIDQNVFFSLLTLLKSQDQGERCQLLCKIIAQNLGAEYCFILSPPNESGEVKVVCGYDLVREIPVAERTIDQALIPGFSTVIRRNQMLTIQASSSKLDELSQNLGLPHAGALLGVPIIDRDNNLLNVLALFSPQSGRPWTSDEQDLIQHAAPMIAEILGSKDTSDVSNTKKWDELKTKLVQLSRENEHLINEMASLQAQNRVYEEQGSQDQNMEFDSAAIEQITRVKGELAAANQRILELEAGVAATNQQPGNQPEMIASMVQELRQPLASINGYAEMLLSQTIGELTAVQEKFLNRIKNSTNRMSGLIADLTKMTEIDSNEIQLVYQPFDLGEVIDDVINLTGVQIRQKQIALRVDLPRQLPEIESDRGAVQQVLMNLMQNASAITPQEGVVRLIGEVIQAADQPAFVRISVIDSGEGIPAEDLPRVFTRMHQAENPLIPGIGDTGVGLSIARSLSKKLGGDLTVESALGQGSNFKLVLPVKPANAITRGGSRP